MASRNGRKRKTYKLELSITATRMGTQALSPFTKRGYRAEAGYSLFLYTMMPPIKITSITTANIKKVLSMVAPFARTRHATN